MRIDRPNPSAAVIFARLVVALGDDGAAYWLGAKNSDLNGLRPIDSMRTASGREHVYRIVQQLAGGTE